MIYMNIARELGRRLRHADELDLRDQDPLREHPRETSRSRFEAQGRWSGAAACRRTRQASTRSITRRTPRSSHGIRRVSGALPVRARSVIQSRPRRAALRRPAGARGRGGPGSARRPALVMRTGMLWRYSLCDLAQAPRARRRHRRSASRIARNGARRPRRSTSRTAPSWHRGGLPEVQSTAQPKAAVGAADARARRMDAAAGAVGSQVDAGRSAELPQLVDAEHRAAEGAAPAVTHLRVSCHELRTGPASAPPPRRRTTPRRPPRWPRGCARRRRSSRPPPRPARRRRPADPP